MNIQIPEESINTLEQLANTLKKSIEAREGTIIALDADISVKKRAVIAENYTIEEQSKQKAELTGQINALIIQKSSKDIEVQTAQDVIEKAKSELEAIRLETTELLEKKSEMLNDISTKEQGLVERENALSGLQKSLQEKEIELSGKETALVDKHNAIKELAVKLA